MAISIALQDTSPRSATHVFDTMVDVRNWDDYAGVTLNGPPRPIVVGDRIEITLAVGPVQIRCGLQAEVVDAPTDAQGSVVLRTIDGPVVGELVGTVVATADGCDVAVAVNGATRGPARLVDRPLDLIANRWASHQMRHLLAMAAAST